MRSPRSVDSLRDVKVPVIRFPESFPSNTVRARQLQSGSQYGAMVSRIRPASTLTRVMSITVQGFGSRSSVERCLTSPTVDAARARLSDGEKVISTSPKPVSACSGSVNLMFPWRPVALLQYRPAHSPEIAEICSSLPCTGTGPGDGVRWHDAIAMTPTDASGLLANLLFRMAFVADNRSYPADA